MTLIYVPRLIESAEQAEALPRLSFWFDPAEAEDDGWIQPWIMGHGVWFGDDEAHLDPSDLIGQKVFVPIEAEEETLNRPSTALGDAVRALAGRNSSTLHRLVTPWTPTEEA